MPGGVSLRRTRALFFELAIARAALLPLSVPPRQASTQPECKFVSHTCYMDSVFATPTVLVSRLHGLWYSPLPPICVELLRFGLTFFFVFCWFPVLDVAAWWTYLRVACVSIDRRLNRYYYDPHLPLEEVKSPFNLIVRYEWESNRHHRLLVRL